MPDYSVALMIYGEPGSNKSVFTEEKYKKLATHFIETDFEVTSICYHDSVADELLKKLIHYDAVLVWINPIEQQGDRKRLDLLLKEVALQGVFVSAHPDVILKIGTKEILYTTRNEEFGTAVALYTSFENFKKNFLYRIDAGGVRILKQYRGNGGKGVFKIDATEIHKNRIIVTQATQGDENIQMTVDDFYLLVQPYFTSGSMLIDQEWNPNIINGMVRCYICGDKVGGFGYQEINALYPVVNSVFKKPSQRFYFTEECSLFRDLKQIMETRWISRLQKITDLENSMLPVIWDADFFINKIDAQNPSEKYSLCEINVSSVSPFPESAIPFIVEETRNRIRH